MKPILPMAALLAVLATIPATQPALAEADGPDFYRVRLLYPGTGLALQTAPGAGQKVIVWLPHNARKIRNHGCKGGLTFDQHQKATPAERRAGRFRRWCRVEWRGKRGWVNGGYLREDR